MEFLEETLSWANYAPSDDKIGFIKRFLNCCGHDELGAIRSMCARAKVKPNAFERRWRGPRYYTGRGPTDPDERSMGVLTPEPSVRKPLMERFAEEKFEGEWFKQYSKKDFQAFDTEAVPVKTGKRKRNGNESCVMKACEVSVVNEKFQPDYEEKIYHKAGTFDINQHTIRINGVTRSNQLEDGTPLETVKEKFIEATKNKILITVKGEADFSNLDLQPYKFPNFDLQQFYQRTSKNNPNVMEPMSLRDMYFYHFEEDIQRGIHSARVDAQATMKVFLKGYTKICDQTVDFDDVPILKKLEEAGKWWCKKERKFLAKCSCVECARTPSFD